MLEYKDIIGKTIIFDGTECFIAGANPEIGIALKELDSDDPEAFVYCFIVKEAIQMGLTQKEINHLFYKRVKLFRENNEVEGVDIIKLRESEGNNNPMYSLGICPFSS